MTDPLSDYDTVYVIQLDQLASQGAGLLLN